MKTKTKENSDNAIFGDCIFCFGLQTCKEGLDKRGRPFFSCKACGTKAFLHSEAAVVGPAVMRAFITAVGARSLQYWIAMNGQEATLTGMNALVGETASRFKEHIRQTAAASLTENAKASLLQSS